MENSLPVDLFNALRILDLMLGVNLLPLHARETILWVSCSVETSTRSGAFRPNSAMICVMGCSPRLRSISKFILKVI